MSTFDDFMEKRKENERKPMFIGNRKGLDELLADFQRAQDMMKLLMCFGFSEEEIPDLNLNLFAQSNGGG